MLRELTADFERMPAVEWEQLAHRFAQWLIGMPLRHSGQSVRGNPRGYIIDSYTPDGTVGAEHSTEQNYFVTLTKPKRDFAHVRLKMPSATTVLLLCNWTPTAQQEMATVRWEVETAARTGISIHVFGGRHLAELVADEILESDAAVEEFAEFIEPLRRLRDLYAVSNTIPSQTADFVSRPTLEQQVARIVRHHRVGVLAGMSGVGKTALAVAAANAARAHSDWVLWVPAGSLTDVQDLAAVDVTRRGIRHNLLGMLRTRACFLVLDDLAAVADLRAFVVALTAQLGPRSCAVITSQRTLSAPWSIDVPMMDANEAASLLGKGRRGPVPAVELRRMLSAVGGHPFALRLLRGLSSSYSSWADVAEEAEYAGMLPAAQQTETLANRVLGRYRATLDRALGVFLWCGSPVVHRAMLQNVARGGAIDSLSTLGLLAAEPQDTVRLHDIVWRTLPALTPPVAVDRQAYVPALDAFLRKLANDDTRTATVSHLARLHHQVLAESLDGSPSQSGLLYAWMHRRRALTDPEVPLATIEETVAFAVANRQNHAALLAAVERLEDAIWDITRARPATQRDESRDADGLLAHFAALRAQSPRTSRRSRHVRHHEAKALKRLGRRAEALALLEDIHRVDGDSTANATKLLLARTYLDARPPEQTEGDVKAAEAFLRDILETARARPSMVSDSVVLAAADLLRRRALRIDLRAVVLEYHETLGARIRTATQRGLEQGPIAWAALVHAWCEAAPESLHQLVQDAPFPAVDADLSTDERSAWGEVLSAVGSLARVDSEAMLREALSFHQAAGSMFSRSHVIDLTRRLGDPNGACALAHELIASIEFARLRRPEERAWIRRRLADALLDAGRPDDALEEIAAACDELDSTSPLQQDFAEWREDRRGRAFLLLAS